MATRQGGKSAIAAALALNTALLKPGSLTLLVSRAQRQSGELFQDKVLRLFNSLGRPLATKQESALTMRLSNNSRIVSLPGDEETIRCYSGVDLLIIDEAARVPDALYFAVRPMLATSNGRLLALSTPFGKRGWFYEEWISNRKWERTRSTADQCPRISKEFLAEEREAMGDRWYNQEYFCSFEDTVGSLFSQADIDSMFTGCEQPLILS